MASFRVIGQSGSAMSYLQAQMRLAYQGQALRMQMKGMEQDRKYKERQLQLAAQAQQAEIALAKSKAKTDRMQAEIAVKATQQAMLIDQVEFMTGMVHSGKREGNISSGELEAFEKSIPETIRRLGAFSKSIGAPKEIMDAFAGGLMNSALVNKAKMNNFKEVMKMKPYVVQALQKKGLTVDQISGMSADEVAKQYTSVMEQLEGQKGLFATSKAQAEEKLTALRQDKNADPTEITFWSKKLESIQSQEMEFLGTYNQLSGENQRKYAEKQASQEALDRYDQVNKLLADGVIDKKTADEWLNPNKTALPPTIKSAQGFAEEVAGVNENLTTSTANIAAKDISSEIGGGARNVLGLASDIVASPVKGAIRVGQSDFVRGLLGKDPLPEEEKMRFRTTRMAPTGFGRSRAGRFLGEQP